MFSIKRYVFTSAMCKAADLSCEKYGVSLNRLMENAAFALYDAITKEYDPYKVVILCGNGNNGGDGYTLASIMDDRGYDVRCIKVIEGEMSPLCRDRFFDLKRDLVIDYSLEKTAALENILSADVVVDCIFGTGFRGILPDEIIELSSYIENKTVVACDIPSGINADNGLMNDCFIKADLTVTFAFYKPCFFMTNSAKQCGKVVLADIGFPLQAIEDQQPWISVIDGKAVKDIIKDRDEWGHKGTFGSVQLICGSDDMTGAAIMSAMAALKSGIGLEYLTLPEKAKRVVQTNIPEAVYVDVGEMPKVNAQLVGPGLGKNNDSIHEYLFREIPTVVDADAINYISQHKDLLESIDCSKMIFTPHPLEMARLLDETVENIESNRFDIASDFSMRYGCVLVLKGHKTIIALPDGNIYVNMTGNSGLAKGGSGDVLSGFIAGLTARGYDLKEAALLGVYLHGSAADYLEKEGVSKDEMLPEDIINVIGKKELLLG